MSQQQDQQRLLLERFQREVSSVVIRAGTTCVAKHTTMCRHLRVLEASPCSAQQARTHGKVLVCCNNTVWHAQPGRLPWHYDKSRRRNAGQCIS